jgi:hypothetical protein
LEELPREVLLKVVIKCVKKVARGKRSLFFATQRVTQGNANRIGGVDAALLPNKEVFTA